MALVPGLKSLELELVSIDQLNSKGSVGNSLEMIFGI